MGRGAYDTTNPATSKSEAAMEALRRHNIQKNAEAAQAAKEKEATDFEKLIRSKKSRGIMAAKRAEKEKAKEAAEAIKKEPDHDSDSTVKT